LEIFFQEPGDKTPMILFDPLQGKFEIIGVSIPDNGKDFYTPALEWINQYVKNPNPLTGLTINLDYFNISSSKMILFILYKLMELNQKGFEVLIKWCYNDEELLEAGEDYSYITKLNFEFIKVSKSEFIG
jgi:hypothetical protein